MGPKTLTPPTLACDDDHMLRARRELATVAVAVLALSLVSCGDDNGGEAQPTSTAGEATPVATDTPGPTETPSATPDEPTATPTLQPTATPDPTSEPTTTPDLPGDPFDVHVPTDGEIIGVIGVAFDDILEVHEQPGELSPLVGTLPNLADTVEGTGEGRLLPASIWWRVRYEGIEGWAGSGFLARIGDTFDITSEVISRNGGVYPQAETMLALGNMVADIMKSDDPPSRVVISVAPSVGGDLGEITMDVVGLGDDATRGLRLHIFGDSADMGGEGFALSNVESTILCGRGVSGGLCV
jgi:hypothetical protein